MKSSPEHHTSLMASIDSVPHNSSGASGAYQGKQRDVRVRKQKGPNRIPLAMAKTTIDQIIYPVKTKKGLKHGPKRRTKDDSGLYNIPQSLMQDSQALQRRSGKLLDGFLILYSCRVKLPHEAIKSKLDSQNIMEVIEEDLCYF